MSSKEAGIKLKNWRERSGITQFSFASKIGISQAFVSQLENGERPVSLNVSAAIEHETGGEITMQEWVNTLSTDETKGAA